MARTTEITALQHISNRSVDATRFANKLRDQQESWQERNDVDMKSYRMGEAIGLLDASKIMEKELRRLCNRFQNGCLSIDDFGIVL